MRVTGPSELAFPDYDGNGMFKSLGNVLVNPNVGLLFIALHGKPQRLRVNGHATLSNQALNSSFGLPRGQFFRIVHAIFPLCR